MEVEKQKKNTQQGITIETIVTKVIEAYGWEELAIAVPINCFKDNPSINSSIKFLRKTPGARAKLVSFFLYAVRKGKCSI